MGIARCHDCGLAIRGVWKRGAPKACPACGCDYSKRIVEERALEAIKKKHEAIKAIQGKEHE